MTHTEFLSNLPAETAAELAQRSDRPALLRLAVHGGLLKLGALWVALGWPLWWAILLPYGILLVFLFTLEHECTHKTPFASEALGERVGQVCGALLLIPFQWFRYFHLAHHRHTHIEGKDPELEGGTAHLERWGPFLWHVSGLPLWAAQIKLLVRVASGDADFDYVPERAKGRIISEARWHLALYTAALASLWITPLLFWIWLLPALLGQPFLRLYLMAEHGRCAFAADMFDNTRTTLTNRLVRWIAWNMPYHTEHHVMPNVPFHQLPALHDLMKGNLRHVSQGYSAFTAETLRILPRRQ